jgi:hypothetical protein
METIIIEMRFMMKLRVEVKLHIFLTSALHGSD